MVFVVLADYQVACSTVHSTELKQVDHTVHYIGFLKLGNRMT